MKSNPFDPGIYDNCLIDDCTNKTQHKSGYCGSHRTFKCFVCHEVFISHNSFNLGRPKCGYCRCKFRSRKNIELEPVARIDETVCIKAEYNTTTETPRMGRKNEEQSI